MIKYFSCHRCELKALSLLDYICFFGFCFFSFCYCALVFLATNKSKIEKKTFKNKINQNRTTFIFVSSPSCINYLLSIYMQQKQIENAFSSLNYFYYIVMIRGVIICLLKIKTQLFKNFYISS